MLKNPVLIGLYTMSFLLPTGYYTAYSYIEPYLKQIALMDDAWITITLVIFGAAGLLGSAAFSNGTINAAITSSASPYLALQLFCCCSTP